MGKALTRRANPPSDTVLAEVCRIVKAAGIDPQSEVGAKLVSKLIDYIAVRDQAMYDFGAGFRNLTQGGET